MHSKVIFVTRDGERFDTAMKAESHCLDKAQRGLANAISSAAPNLEMSLAAWRLSQAMVLKASEDPSYAESIKQVVQWLEDAREDEDEDEDT